ncbi:MAG: plasmid mobilization protein [Candidatus Dormibacteria bacterium]
MAEPRSRTLAFRVTEAEGQTIDTLARGMGVKPSEYARLAALDVAKIKAHALSAARAEVRRELAATRDALARIVDAYDALQRKAEAHGQVELELSATRKSLVSMADSYSLLRSKAQSLEAKLHRAPEELVVAVKQLIAGAPDARAEVAQIWARIRPYPSFDREESQEIIAAEVADLIESIVTRFRTDGKAFAEWPNLRRRIEWLFDGVHLNAGKGFRRGGGRPDAVWKPVVDALDQAEEERRRYAPDFVDS